MATNTKLREMGNRIKKRRSELNITQEMLALKLDVTPHYIYEIEAGNKQPRVDKLLKIAKFLETSIDYLVTGDYFINSSIASSVILETNDYQADKLDSLIQTLPVNKRDAIADIVEVVMKNLD